MAVQTQIQVRRGTAATWTSTNPTLAAGEWGLETDTGKYKIGTGSAVWTSLGYASILPSTVTTKGDLLAASGNATVTRQAVGSDGYQLVADSSQTTGLGWAGNAAAGKNAIINGGFDIWQRGTSFAADLTYSADRWLFNRSGGVGGSTVSRSTDVPTGFQYSMKNQRDNGQTGTAALNGYYNIETVNSIPFAGQTVILSFYAKKGANYSGGNFSITLTSGTGTDQRVYSYTGAATVATSTTISLSTSWTRYSITGTVATNATELGITTAWTPSGTAGADDSVYMTGFQLELGSSATPFSRAGGTIQGELAACQRYFEKSYNSGTAPATNTDAGAFQKVDIASSTTGTYGVSIEYKVAKRTTPTITLYSSISSNSGKWVLVKSGGQTEYSYTVYSPQENVFIGYCNGAATGLTTYNPYPVIGQWTASAEL